MRPDPAPLRSTQRKKAYRCVSRGEKSVPLRSTRRHLSPLPPTQQHFPHYPGKNLTSNPATPPHLSSCQPAPAAPTSDFMSQPLKTQLRQALARPLIQYLLLFLAVLCVYLPTLWYTFVWDDYGMIGHNKSIRSWSNILKFFTDPGTFVRHDPDAHNLFAWRPLRNVYFLITYKIHGLRPAGWHFQHVLLHCVCTCLLLVFFRRVYNYLNSSPFGAPLQPTLQAATWVAAFAWAVHPANTEILGWMKAADDILACICGLAALCLLLNHAAKPSTKNIILASLFYTAGLLFKESLPPIAIIYPALLLILTHQPRQAVNKRTVIATSSLIITTMIYIVTRHLVLGMSDQGVNLAGSYSLLLATMTTAVVHYLQITFWPFWPTVLTGSYFGYPIAGSWLDKNVLISIALILLITSLMFLLGRRNRPLLAGYVFAALAFLPVANILPMAQIMAERFMYFPLMGIALSLTSILYWIFSRRNYLLNLAPCVVVCALIIRTEMRLPVWTDEAAFQTSIVKTNPLDAKALFNLGAYHYNTHNNDPALIQETLRNYSRVLAINPAGLSAYDKSMVLDLRWKSALAASTFLTDLKQYKKALKYVNYGIGIKPDIPDTIILKADILRLDGQTTKSLKFYRVAEEMGYSSAIFYFHIAEDESEIGKKTEAIKSLKKALELDPNLPPAKTLFHDLTSSGTENKFSDDSTTE